LIKLLRYFARGLRFGTELGVVVFLLGMLAYSFEAGVLSAVVMMTVVALMYVWAFVHADKRRAREGITLEDPPEKPEIVLCTRLAPEALMELGREALNAFEHRIKQVQTDEPRRIVALTRQSRLSRSETLTIQVGQAGTLEISSVPAKPSKDLYGTNYLNVFQLVKLIKARMPADALVSETLVDLDKS
jgi:hypothetical protein